MSRRKSYRKYAPATMAVAVAASAVAPVVALADDTKFTDVSEKNDHYDNIYALAEKEIVTGMPDGTFKPEDSIFRAQAAVMFVRALNLETPDNVAEVLEVYTDVNENSEYADEIAAVTAAGIFGQFDKGKKGKFNAWTHINREQMASVLVRAYDLGDIKADKVDINLNKVSPVHEQNVQTLANLDLTNALDNFLPIDDVTRGQFSSFLNRTITLVEEHVDLISKLSAVYNATDGEKLLVALNDLKLENINADNIADYASALEELKSKVDENEFTTEIAQKLVNDVNEANVEKEVQTFKDTHKHVLGLEAEGNSDKLVKADELLDVNKALTAFDQLSDKAQLQLADEQSLLEDLQVTAQNRYLFDVNTINGEGNMSEKLAVLENDSYEKLSAIQKVEVAKFLIIKRDALDESKFTKFEDVESTLNIAITDYKELLNNVNKAEAETEIMVAVTEIAEVMGVTLAETEQSLLHLVLEQKPENGYESVTEVIKVIR